MQAYFDGRGERSSGVSLTIIFMFLLGVAGILLAALILLGWIPLGERANISRRDINAIEWIVVIGSGIFALGCLRTTWGMIQRERSAWAWAQWMSFVALFVGVAVALSELIPLGFSFISNLPRPDVDLTITSFGIILFVLSTIEYMFVVRDVRADDEKVEKAQGAFSTHAADLTPIKRIRFSLAQSPSAGAIIGFVVIFFMFSVATDLFLEPTSIASILTNVSTKGIVAIGVTILMISGEFDLSVGSQLGAISLMFMLFMTELGLGADSGGVLLAMVLALIFGCILGLINGLILVLTGIPSFIVTLGTLLAYRALPLVLIPGGRILRFRDHFDEFPVLTVNHLLMVVLAVIIFLIILYTAFRTLPRLWRGLTHKWNVRHSNGDFGTTAALWSALIFILLAIVLIIIGIWAILLIIYHLERGGTTFDVGLFDVANGRWSFTLEEVTRGIISINIPIAANFRNSILWWFALVAIFHIVLTQTPYGNSVFAVGGNPGAARAQGINVSRIKVFNFVLVSFLVGIAAILETTRNPGVDPLKGELWELEVIAMTVIGGTLLSGGYGSVIGSLLGALIFGMLQTGLVIVGMNARLFNGVVGIVTIVAVVLNTAVRGNQKS